MAPPTDPPDPGEPGDTAAPTVPERSAEPPAAETSAPETSAPAPPVAEPTEGDLAATYCATLVDEWVARGLTHAVVSPGSRSTPMAVALLADGRVHVEVVHDERSAAYMALGIARATRRAALVLSTSGTAAVHFHAAVVEADLAAVPLLVITADRPPEMRGRLAPQTIDQRDLYGRAVRWYCEPGPPAAGGAPWWRDLATDALVRTAGLVPGPVHLNLAFREPLVGTPTTPPPQVLPAARHTEEHDLRARAGGAKAGGWVGGGAVWGVADEEVGRLAAALSGRRGLLICGERTAFDHDGADAVWALADHLGWPVLADPQSGMRRPRAGLVTAADSLLRHEVFAESHRPEVVLRIGGLLTSRVLNEWLVRSGAFQVGIDRFGRCPDPDGVLSTATTVRPDVVADALVAAGPAPAAAEWRESWDRAESLARGAVARALVGVGDATEPTVAMDVMAAAAPDTSVVVSSSMPVRDLEWYAPARADVRTVANRGANGIDGVTAMAVGVALGSGRPTVLITGDVAFLHDSAALVALRRRPVDLVVVVVDNDGGGIFGFLPQAEALAPADFETLFATPHGTDLVALARAHGLSAEAVSSRAGLQAALAGAVARGGPRVVVVSTDRRRNVALHRRLGAAVGDALAARFGGPGGPSV